MSSKAKHALRSHKTYNSNYSVFSSFSSKALTKANIKKTKKSGFERIKEILSKGLFRKHQGK